MRAAGPLGVLTLRRAGHGVVVYSGGFERGLQWERMLGLGVMVLSELPDAIELRPEASQGPLGSPARRPTPATLASGLPPISPAGRLPPISPEPRGDDAA